MDTGYAGTIGAVSFDKALGESFFAKNDILPRAYKARGIDSWPAPDHSFVPGGAGGAITYTKGKMVMTSSVGSQQGLIGWNFGANYNKALIIMGGVQTIRHRTLLIIQDGAPTNNSAQSANGLDFWNEKFNESTLLGSFTAAGGVFGGHSSLQNGNATLRSSLRVGFSYQSMTMALYVDVVAAVMKAYMRWGLSSWVEVMSQSTSHLATCRTASILGQTEGTAPTGMTFTTPIGVYAGN